MAESDQCQDAGQLGGYECSFVEELSKDFQSECPVCLHVLRQPNIVGCCGYRFCQVCIQPIQKDGGKCPLCKDSFGSLPDRQLERILNDKTVYCSYKDNGCPWSDKLKDLDQHVKICLFKKVPCLYCAQSFERFWIEDHEKTCPSRPVLCPHCKAHRDSEANIKSKHFALCPMHPVPCPHDCGSSPFRKNLQKHIDNSCPNSKIDCAFKYIGCTARLRRGEMAKHKEEKLSEHVAESKKILLDLWQENAKLKEELAQCQLARQLEDSHARELLESHLVQVQYLAATNLPPNASVAMLTNVFGLYGFLKDIELANDGRLARVEYESEESARMALSQGREGRVRLKSHILIVTPIYTTCTAMSSGRNAASRGVSNINSAPPPMPNNLTMPPRPLGPQPLPPSAAPHSLLSTPVPIPQASHPAFAHSVTQVHHLAPPLPPYTGPSPHQAGPGAHLPPPPPPRYPMPWQPRNMPAFQNDSY